MPDTPLSIVITSVQYTLEQEPVLVRWRLVEPTGLFAALGAQVRGTTQTALNALATARGAEVWSDEDVAADLVAALATDGITAVVA